MDNGLCVVYLPVNQAWALLWNDHILGIFDEKAHAQAEMACLLR